MHATQHHTYTHIPPYATYKYLIHSHLPHNTINTPHMNTPYTTPHNPYPLIHPRHHTHIYTQKTPHKHTFHNPTYTHHLPHAQYTTYILYTHTHKHNTPQIIRHHTLSHISCTHTHIHHTLHMPCTTNTSYTT